ncbi:MAG TPA: S53 family peptidase [Candidatus Acidoferrales bacterium]|nr:S53 family peptidase [Candidatus Acidoferrales bacterium]
MKRICVVRFVEALACMAMLAAIVSPGAQGQGWVSTATKAYPAQYVPNLALTGPLPASTTMHIAVGLQEQNESQVQPTLKRMITPGDSLFGTSITVDQFAAQFGATSTQVQAVTTYLTNSGLTNVTVAPNNLIIEADGTAGEVEEAFNTSLSQYSLNGVTVFANTTAAQVPSSLSGIVVAVLGLNNIAQLHTDVTKLSTGPQKFTDPCTPPECPTPDTSNESFTAQQYQIAYDAACPSDNPTCAAHNFPTGSTTAVGIIAEGDLTQVVKDLRTYETAYSLPQVPVTVVNAGVASTDTSGADEWDLDSQVSTGIAQQVSHLYFYVATSLTDSDIALAVNKAVTSNKVRAFNMSFGECEFSPFLDGAMLVDDEVFGEAALQGITPFASADDQGSACPVAPTNGVPLSGPPDTSYPASSPYVVAVGGTNLFTNADYTFDFEVAWEGSGGGISVFETAPFWQSFTGTGSEPIVPSAAAGQRGVPDVSMCAGGTELAICAANVFVDGAATLIGGTSLSSPLAMGSWARIESAHKGKLGFAAPLFYQLANGAPTLSSPDFNDVLTGGNGLFTALLGYDFVTGLGSFDIRKVSSVIQ